MRIHLLAAATALTVSLSAQDSLDTYGSVDTWSSGAPRFRIALGLGAGDYDYSTKGSDLDGDTSAQSFRVAFEGTSRTGIGGGIRFESFQSDNDLFDDTGVPALQGAEATTSSFLLHFTYRFENDAFAMPARFGLLVNDQSLESNEGDEIEFFSAGPQIELAPEFTVLRQRRFQMSLYGEFGLGFGATTITLADEIEEFDSTTMFTGAELGTRFQISNFEIGVCWLGRWQDTDESDPSDGIVIFGSEAVNTAFMLQFAVVF